MKFNGLNGYNPMQLVLLFVNMAPDLLRQAQRQVQQALFDLGYAWHLDNRPDRSVFRFLDCDSLVLGNGGLPCWMITSGILGQSGFQCNANMQVFMYPKSFEAFLLAAKKQLEFKDTINGVPVVFRPGKAEFDLDTASETLIRNFEKTLSERAKEFFE